MLSTIDNPYDPYTQYDQWYQWDQDAGYNTTDYLGRIAEVDDDMDDAESERIIDETIDEIVRLNVLGIYIKVEK